ncbi:MAG: c-type cytochrome biogenesis protein CcsB [Deltaproteobacteria bacterium]|nr:c-type cytochrome biogenesis protein CcsB [Deltaproteobacteria bacterium]
MNSAFFLSVTTFIYGLAASLYLAAWVFQKKRLGRVATWMTLCGIAGNCAGFALRWAESYRMGFGRVPLSNLYESLVFFALMIAALYLIVEQKYGQRTIGAFAMPGAFFAMAYASLSPNVSDRIQPLLPALKSNWLTVHVMTCFIGYAAFAIAFGLGLMYVIASEKLKQDKGSLSQRLPDRGILDELTHQMVMFGFLFLSAGIITGAVWANAAWGRYWGWDPKETWSLITWFVYASLLHARLMRGWRRGSRCSPWPGLPAVLYLFRSQPAFQVCTVAGPDRASSSSLLSGGSSG